MMQNPAPRDSETADPETMNDTTLRIERSFDAPVDLVFHA